MSAPTPRRPPRPHRSGAGPLAVLAAIALVPALVLWWISGWADDRSTEAADAVPTQEQDSATVSTETPVGAAPTPAAARLTTGLLSMRRTSSQLSRDLNLAAFQQAVAPLLDSIGDRSCVAVSLDGVMVGERGADRVVIPASNMKVLIASAALDVLGPDFRYTTSVRGTPPAGGVVSGDVFLVGGGDPLLSGDWYPESNLDQFPAFNTTSLDELANRLVAAGVTRIDGALRGDGSRYDDEWYAPGWGEGVAGIEAGPYDALLANDARILGDEQRAGDPLLGAAREFVRILGAHGIAVSGGAAAGVAPTGLAELASIESHPLTDVLAEMLTNSDNNTAELVLKEIGVAAGGAGTRQAGAAVVASTIAGWGVDTSGLVVSGGSGLSLDDRVTCRTLLGVLQHVGVDSPIGDGLAIAAETGTLRNVFEDTPMAGRLRGKTGTLGNVPYDQDPPAVKSLSGYVPIDGGGAIEFALLLNDAMIDDQRNYRPIWDRMVTAFASFPSVASPAQLGPR